MPVRIPKSPLTTDGRDRRRLLGDGDLLAAVIDVDLVGQGHGHSKSDDKNQYGKQIGLTTAAL